LRRSVIVPPSGLRFTLQEELGICQYSIANQKTNPKAQKNHKIAIYARKKAIFSLQ
jgi:hypothetical protein